MQSFLVRDFGAEYTTLALPYRLRNFSTLVVMDADIMFICEDVFGFICRLRTARRKRKVLQLTQNTKLLIKVTMRGLKHVAHVKRVRPCFSCSSCFCTRFSRFLPIQPVTPLHAFLACCAHVLSVIKIRW